MISDSYIIIDLIRFGYDDPDYWWIDILGISTPWTKSRSLFYLSRYEDGWEFDLFFIKVIK